MFLAYESRLAPRPVRVVVKKAVFFRKGPNLTVRLEYEILPVGSPPAATLVWRIPPAGKQLV
jgi:hypothetical protein